MVPVVTAWQRAAVRVVSRHATARISATDTEQSVRQCWGFIDVVRRFSFLFTQALLLLLKYLVFYYFSQFSFSVNVLLFFFKVFYYNWSYDQLIQIIIARFFLFNKLLYAYSRTKNTLLDKKQKKSLLKYLLTNLKVESHITLLQNKKRNK